MISRRFVMDIIISVVNPRQAYHGKPMLNDRRDIIQMEQRQPDELEAGWQSGAQLLDGETRVGIQPVGTWQTHRDEGDGVPRGEGVQGQALHTSGNEPHCDGGRDVL